MKSDRTNLFLSRRRFLASAPALSAMCSLAAEPAFADETHHEAPFVGLEPFIAPGKDEFPGETLAMRIRASLEDALRSGVLPITAHCGGSSVYAARFRDIASDLQESVFDPADREIALGWKNWTNSLGTIRRSHFYPLADDVLRFEVAGEHEGRPYHRVGLWNQRWHEGQLTHFSPLEEHVAFAAKPYFRDVTATVFANASSFEEQLARGIPYWRARLDPATGIDIYGSNGIAVGDIDGDGVDEVYVCQPGGLPNRLYKFKENGTLTDITAQWNAGILDDTSSALFLDLRNTGRQDLVVLRGSGPILFLNDGATFRLRTDAFHFRDLPAGGFTGMAAADFDRDGNLDLYLCCYVYFQSEAQYTYPSPYHDAQNGPPNFLFRNRLTADGNGSFEDCTKETGIDENNNRFSFAPAWCDSDNNGWPDLYVANDFGRKNFYRNEGGHFRDMAAQAGVEDLGPGMSASWFDYDGDGKPDLYVANMWSDAGQRLSREKNFQPAQGAVQQAAYVRHTRGNSLYRNRGDGTFEETTLTQHVEFGRWAWSSGGHDFDNDGHPEIFITCGMLTNSSTTDLMGFFWRDVVARSPATATPSAAYEAGWNALNQFVREDYSWNGHEPNVLHCRRGDRYYDFSGVSGLDFASDSRAFSVVDFDGDGRPDVILKSRLGPQVRLLQNACAEDNRSIAFRLHGTKSNRDAIGALISVDGQTKWLEAGSGYLSQHSKQILFGLGKAESVRLVDIVWPSGTRQRVLNLKAGAIYSIVEGEANHKSEPFRSPRPVESKNYTTSNELALHDTWLAEPVPLPERHAGPGLLILTNGTSAPISLGVPMKCVDLGKVSADTKRQYEIFRRYLFDWRTQLSFPFCVLLNNAGQVVKIYGRLPSAAQSKADLAKLGSITLQDALPFEGTYVKPPRRDFYKWGAAFLQSGYFNEAMPYLQEVLKRTPENARVLLLVGQIHLQAGRLDDAETSVRQVLALNSKYAEAFSVLGDILDARNKSAQALEQYEKALALKPDLSSTLLNGAQTADKLGDIPKARSWYERALQLDPKSADAANGLGLALAKQNEPDEARHYFEQAISLRRNFSGAINNLGVLYLKQGKVQDAIAAFEYGIRQAPDDDILYFNLGRTYTQLGQFEKARGVMQTLLDRKPEDATARRAIQELDHR